MSIGIYKISSALSDRTDLTSKEFLSSVETELGDKLELMPLEEYEKLDFGLLFVATGGSEGGFLQEFDKLTSKPCHILTSGDSNSLAASMEILSYLHSKGKKGEILHGDVGETAARIRALRSASYARQKLKGARFGVVGAPSDWLIASAADAEAYKAKLGASLVDIPMSELIEETKKGEYSGNKWTEQLFASGYDKGELEKALAVYGALERIVRKYELSGVTVRCFDLLSTVHTTGCLALAILNAEGIYAGCEGDVPSLVSMAILGAISEEPVFMCNPSRIDKKAGEMVLAHCTLPMNMPACMTLMTHFESGIGVAIAGKIPGGCCTVFKTSGDLSRYYAKSGVIERNLTETSLCRTQIAVALDNFDYFTDSPINNHHLVCHGDHSEAISEFFKMIK